MTLESCQAACTADTMCAGIYFYNQSGRCKGLHNLGSDAMTTAVNADSYTKIV